MLSEDHLRSAYESGFLDPDLRDDVQAWELAALRAVEAAVRADQIEKDAGIADKLAADKDAYSDKHNNSFVAEQSLGCRGVSRAIRAQLTEGNGDE